MARPDGSLTRTVSPSGIAPFGQFTAPKSPIFQTLANPCPAVATHSLFPRVFAKVRIFLGSS